MRIEKFTRKRATRVMYVNIVKLLFNHNITMDPILASEYPLSSLAIQLEYI